MADGGASARRSAAIPLGVLGLAMLVWAASIAWSLKAENERLRSVRASQETLLQNSQKLRASLDALASETAKLAAQGNPNARLLVDELRKRGVTINPGPRR
jgi:hypothetical protein